MFRVRFAPSPTGNLHQGNVRTALFNYLFARQHQGKMILRIEDTDQVRSELAYENSIYADLKWLGIDYDEGPDRSGAVGPYRQSERLAIYQKYLNELELQGKVYPCYCSQEDLDQQRKRALAAGKPYTYSGVCQPLSPEERAAKQKQGLTPSYRFKVEPQYLKFHDLVYGEKTFDTRNIGDFVISRSNELPLYLFVCAIDDCLMGITHVIRGEDGLSNAPRQILIQRALGFEPPQFAHLPLILGPDHTLLSKRNGQHSVAELRCQGYLPEAVINYLATLGWAPPKGEEFFNLERLIATFDLTRVSRSGAIFDIQKLNHLNHHYLSRLAATDYLREAHQTLVLQGKDYKSLGNRLDKVLLTLQPNLRYLGELPTWLDHFVDLPDLASSEAKPILSDPTASTILSALQTALLSLPEDLSAADYHQLVESVKNTTQLKGKKLFMPLRIALTGTASGPELAALIPALGKQTVMERIERAIKSL